MPGASSAGTPGIEAFSGAARPRAGDPGRDRRVPCFNRNLCPQILLGGHFTLVLVGPVVWGHCRRTLPIQVPHSEELCR